LWQAGAHSRSQVGSCSFGGKPYPSRLKEKLKELGAGDALVSRGRPYEDALLDLGGVIGGNCFANLVKGEACAANGNRAGHGYS
jgi:hypothetical protein